MTFCAKIKGALKGAQVDTAGINSCLRGAVGHRYYGHRYQQGAHCRARPKRLSRKL
jgi:hypothetical protein